MAYDDCLAGRVRELLPSGRDLSERKMFGGLGFLLRGNILVGVWKDSLIARVGPDDYPAALREPWVREFDITGRPMTGWVMVGPAGLADDTMLRSWIERAEQFVRTLPPK